MNGTRRFQPGQVVAPLALAAVFTVALAAPAGAQAVGGGDLTSFLDNLANLIQSTLARSLSILALTGVGLAALMGWLSLRTVVGVLAGIGILNAAPWIVDQIMR